MFALLKPWPSSGHRRHLRCALRIENADDLLGFSLGTRMSLPPWRTRRERVRCGCISGGAGFVDGAVFDGVAEKRFFVFLKAGIFVFEHGEPVKDAVFVNTPDQTVEVLPMAMRVM